MGASLIRGFPGSRPFSGRRGPQEVGSVPRCPTRLRRARLPLLSGVESVRSWRGNTRSQSQESPFSFLFFFVFLFLSRSERKKGISRVLEKDVGPLKAAEEKHSDGGWESTSKRLEDYVASSGSYISVAAAGCAVGFQVAWPCLWSGPLSGGHSQTKKATQGSRVGFSVSAAASENLPARALSLHTVLPPSTDFIRVLIGA